MQEVFVMVIGAICDEDACLAHIEPQLHAILPFLSQQLSSTPLSKSSAYYALSKFAVYLTARNEYCSLIQMTLQGMQDSDENV